VSLERPQQLRRSDDEYRDAINRSPPVRFLPVSLAPLCAAAAVAISLQTLKENSFSPFTHRRVLIDPHHTIHVHTQTGSYLDFSTFGFFSTKITIRFFRSFLLHSSSSYFHTSIFHPFQFTHLTPTPFPSIWTSLPPLFFFFFFFLQNLCSLFLFSS